MKIRTDSADDNALILLANGELVAILMELTDEAHDADRGRWTIEATFGVGSPRSSAIFASAVHAAAWVSDHLCHGWFFDLGRPIDELT